MKYIVFFISGVTMLHSFHEPFVFCKLILLMLLGATVEDIYSDSLNKPDLRESFDRAKT